MKKLVPLLVFLFGALPALAFANDLHYASVVDFQGGNLLLKYHTTVQDDLYSACDLETAECTEPEEERGEAFDDPLPYRHTLSPDGSRAIAEIASLDSRSYWALYDIDGSHADFLKLLEFGDRAAGASITYANDVAVFRFADGTLVREDLSSGELTSTTTGQASLPFFSISEHGRYASSYNYEDEEHTIWDLVEGGTIERGANMQSYVVYSGDETRVAFLQEEDGFNKLFVGETDNPESTEGVASGDFTVVEYEFIGDTLFYIANTESEPLQWNLYAYDPGAEEVTVVEEGVAYDDEYLNLKRTSDRIFYQVIEGRNRNYVAYNPAIGERAEFSAVSESEVNGDLSREVLTLADRTAVLLSPEDGDDDSPLVIWLHGGPMRQISLNFHPFFGYAVYDDLLERLAGEAYVLKLDYSGSFGYGNEFLDSLVGNTGVSDVEDVENALTELRDEIEFGDVYLLGNSYGGYLALKTLVESPDEFEGAVSIAGVTDWYGLTSRIPSSPFVRNFGGVPNNDTFAAYKAASVYAGLPNVNDDTPMLLFYGEEDATVPTWQSTEFADFAEELGKNVELIAYEEEGHTIMERDSLEDICERVAELVGISSGQCEL